MFERTQQNLIKQKAKEVLREPKIAKVIQVYEHGGEEDDSNFEADVVYDGGTVEERVVPINGPHSDSIAIPKVGDKVIISYLAGETGQPYITDVAYTNKNRPPLGMAGMFRDKYDSDTSPAGDGDIYVTKQTVYDKDVSQESSESATPEDVFIQWAKRTGDEANPVNEDSLPAKVEFYDSPKNDESHITIELNAVDGGDSDATWGIKFDLKTGEFTLVDASGHGITSDGNGNFTWSYNSIEYVEEPGTGSLSL